jgi:hypothetical protein
MRPMISMISLSAMTGNAMLTVAYIVARARPSLFFRLKAGRTQPFRPCVPQCRMRCPRFTSTDIINPSGIFEARPKQIMNITVDTLRAYILLERDGLAVNKLCAIGAP